MSLPPELLPDPMTAVFRLIRDGILAHQGVWDAGLNRARFYDFSRDAQMIDSPQYGDIPELAIFQSGFRFNPAGRNSKSSEIELTFDLYLLADKYPNRVTNLNRVKWELFVAIAALGDSLGVPEYIREVRPVQGSDSAMGEQQYKRGNNTYLSIFRLLPIVTIPREMLRGLFVPVTP